jgi:hypothetical protein
MAVFDTRGSACESRGMKTALMAVLVVVACGGPTKPDTLETARPNQNHDMRHTGEAGHMAGGGEAGAMAALPPEVKTFHDTLAPRWHAEHGPQRTAETCAAIPQFHAQADAIVAAAPPRGADPAAWSASAKQLGDAVGALDAACKAGDAAAFEPAFAEVHHRFHAVMESGGEHGEHGEHHD